MIQKTTLLKLMFAFVFFTSSCSLENRMHLSGYNLNWNKSNQELKNKNAYKSIHKLSEKNSKHSDIVIEETIQTSVVENSIEFSASNLETEKKILKNKKLQDFLRDSIASEKCDTLYLKNRLRIIVKVKEVGETQIQYKKCSDQSGPMLSITKSDVTKVNYSNGTTLQISKDVPKSSFKKLEILGLIGVFVGALAILISTYFDAYLGSILALGALVLGTIGLIKFLTKKDKYKGFALPILSIIIGLTLIILTGILFGYSDLFDNIYIEF